MLFSTSFFMTFVNIVMCVQPNIVVFLTDDQDVELGAMDHMPKTKQLLADTGTVFKNAFVSTPICCPSRSSLLTGLYLHNHGVVNNSVSGGCGSRNWQQGPEKRNLATFLKEVNYTTLYAGKYLNQYGRSSVGGVRHVPPGWDWWVGLVGNSAYYNYTLSVNGKPRRHGDKYPDDYLTNVIMTEATTFIAALNKTSGPFFMMLAPPAPHAPFTSAPPYRGAFKNLRAPRTPAYNRQIAQDKHWMLRAAPNPLPNSVLTTVDEVYRNRLRTLLSVDDLVEQVVRLLHRKHLLDNTYIIFTSDHGYHLGEFSLATDKRQLYEFDIRVPLLLRGPGVPAGVEMGPVVTSVDLAPTVLSMAGVAPPLDMDGVPFVNLPSTNFSGTATPADLPGDSWITASSQRVFLIEYHGEEDTGIDRKCEQRYSRSGMSHCYEIYGCKCQDAANNTYRCVRGITAEDDFVYCLFNDNEHFEEVYNLELDPHQLRNICTSLNATQRSTYESYLEKLSSCRGRSCNLAIKKHG